jgi:hypothetical protein
MARASVRAATGFEINSTRVTSVAPFPEEIGTHLPLQRVDG